MQCKSYLIFFKVPDTNGSELVPYLKKLLNSGVGGKENQNNGQSVPKTSAPNNNNNIAPTTGSGWGDTATKLPRFSKSDHDQVCPLKQCFFPPFVKLCDRIYASRFVALIVIGHWASLVVKKQ